MKTKILALEEYIVNIPKNIRNYIANIIEQVKDAKRKLNNLSETNYNLGIFHINKSNMADAKMRFIFAIKLKPDLTLAHYHLARCHLFNLDFEKARSEFAIALSLNPNLEAAKYRLDILNKTVKLKPTPMQIIEEDYDNFSSRYEDYLENKQKYRAPELLAKVIAKYIQDTNEDASDKRVLDLGCGTGLVGIYLKQLVAFKSLTGVDISTKMLELAKELEIDNKPIYTDMQHCDFLDLKATKRKYSIVTACLSLCYNSDLTHILSKLDELVENDSIFGLVVLKSESEGVVFDYDNGCFAFSTSYLLKTFKKYKWEIVIQEEIKLYEKGSKGLMFLLNK